MPVSKPQAFHRGLLAEVIALGAGVCEAVLEHLARLRGLTDAQHRQAQIADDVALSLAVAELASDRQRRFERRDRRRRDRLR